MVPRPKKRKPASASEILARLKREYPDAHCELGHESPFQLS